MIVAYLISLGFLLLLSSDDFDDYYINPLYLFIVQHVLNLTFCLLGIFSMTASICMKDMFLTYVTFILLSDVDVITTIFVAIGFTCFANMCYICN